MKHITEIHEEVYEFLDNINADSDSYLRFSLRRSNRDSRLDEGYWFYGNDNYLAVSFWSGNDWKNRTPNIIFVIIPSGETYLEINTSDSKIKREFVEKFIVREVHGISASGKKYYKEYRGTNYLESLRWFLSHDKRIIDDIVERNQQFFDNASEDDRIAFIDPVSFEKQKSKVDQYRAKVRQDTFQESNKSIHSIIIEDYGPIKRAGLFDIPQNTQWVFIAGENGTGKTNLLRAIALALTNTKNDNQAEREFKVTTQLFSNKGKLNKVERIANNNLDERRILVNGFAAYGASRLLTNHAGLGAAELAKYRKKAGLLYSLFNNDGILLDLLSKRQKWLSDRKHKEGVDDRLKNIQEILYEIIPNLHKVIFDEFNGIPITKYIEEDENGDAYPTSVTYDKLASGIKSMVAMFGDMMCRLFDQQPDVTDASELTGVVIIDEIDIHLHPKLQKKLVEELTKTFRRIQFIVTTHSPIPLLGAPENSCFFKVERNTETGVELTNLSEIDIFHLLPNAILSSELFEMNTLFSRVTKSPQLVRTEDDYNKIQITDAIREHLKKIAEDINKKNETGR